MATNLAQQYTGSIANTAKNIADIPNFQEVLPFYKAWQGIVPQATLAAESQINPEAQRQYKSGYRDYMSGMASSGGQRFGHGLAGVGSLKAESERNRLAQLQDYLNQYQQGYNQIFYEPSQTAWNKSLTQGIRPDASLASIPTWADLYDKYSQLYGVTSGSSPFYA
jgi:hypothetical protein